MNHNSQQIGIARTALLDFIDNQIGCSKAYAIRWLNAQFTAGLLPEHLAKHITTAWQKPKANFRLTRSTFNAWRKERKQRGHSEPLIRQKGVIVKPWHELALQLRRDNPKRKVTELHREVSQQYPTVSYRQLDYFYDGLPTIIPDNVPMLSGEIQAISLSLLEYLREQGVIVTVRKQAASRQETVSTMPESIREALLEKIISKIPQHEIVEWLKTMERGNHEP